MCTESHLKEGIERGESASVIETSAVGRYASLYYVKAPAAYKPINQYMCSRDNDRSRYVLAVQPLRTWIIDTLVSPSCYR